LISLDEEFRKMIWDYVNMMGARMALLAPAARDVRAAVGY
jgi:hypothetical protein